MTMSIAQRLSILEESIRKAQLLMAECPVCMSAVVPVEVPYAPDRFYRRCPICGTEI